ncbi:MAG: hypothetical protein WA895_01050, partial [Streptosporangiaceae bacterium]
MTEEHPEVGALLDELIAAGRPSSRTLPLPDGRRNFDEMIDPLTDRPEVGAVEDRTIPVPTPHPPPHSPFASPLHRDVPVRI